MDMKKGDIQQTLTTLQTLDEDRFEDIFVFLRTQDI